MSKENSGYKNYSKIVPFFLQQIYLCQPHMIHTHRSVVDNNLGPDFLVGLKALDSNYCRLMSGSPI